MSSSNMWKTASPPVSPKKGRRVRDKIEVSPTNRAKCQRCGEKITKGQSRVGIQAKISTPQGIDVWGIKYYHDGCVTEATKRLLHLGKPVAKKASKKTKQTNQSSASTKSPLKPRMRKQLERDLRGLRRCFAETQDCEEYKIFQNRTLLELTKKLPTNKTELQQCWGIKGKRSDQYGDSILRVISSYLHQQKHQNQRQPAVLQRGGSPGSPSVIDRQTKVSSVGGSDDEIETGPTLSVEDIVAQRVREADARGEVFEII
ncbi:hypothetical protein ACHAXR_004463 [Thalassiosira sp. AJA248-18]